MEEKHLKKFDDLYNKFIFQWSQGKELSNIIQTLKTDQPQVNSDPVQVCPAENCQVNQIEVPEKENCESCLKDNFYKAFPKFLIIKCQNKFPLDDDMEVPIDIVDNFWNKYKQQLIEKIADKTIQKITESIEDILIDVFGISSQYDQSVFNDTALKLVNMLE